MLRWHHPPRVTCTRLVIIIWRSLPGKSCALTEEFSRLLATGRRPQAMIFKVDKNRNTSEMKRGDFSGEFQCLIQLQCLHAVNVSIRASFVLMWRNWLVYAIAPWLGIGGLVGHCCVLLIAEPKGETSNRDALSSPVCTYVYLQLALCNPMLTYVLYIRDTCAMLVAGLHNKCRLQIIWPFGCLDTSHCRTGALCWGQRGSLLPC